MKGRHFFLGLAALLGASGFTAAIAAATETRIREPAVAGLFYPGDTDGLSRTIETYLSAANTERTGTLKALICPHAGYSYSGAVAASGFRVLRGTSYRTVVVLGPSHYALLEAAAVSDADVFRTPLGDVPISPKARELARVRPFELEPRCVVDRPSWAAQSSLKEPMKGRARADTWEHAAEVEVPFLQQTLGRFDILPVVMGDVDPAAAARALAPVLDDETLVVVSSDLSHYHPYAEAQALDRECVDAICALDLDKMARAEACGRIPILTLMHVAKQRGWRPELLDYRNSGDTAGERSRVVGYAAIAFYAGEKESAAAEPLSPEERRFLLGLARRTVEESAAGARLPAVDSRELTPRLVAPRACFVTLTKHGQLRGCIGHLTAQMPLYHAVVENARNAAERDSRFPPVAVGEVAQLAIEVSVLTEPEPLAFSSPDELLGKLQPHRDGVVLQMGPRVATFLPQVWDDLPDKVDFLNHLAMKAGASPGDWRRRGTSVSIYHVESFAESER